MDLKFNQQGEKPKFIHKKDSNDPFRFEIYAIKNGETDYSLIGDYKVLDRNEPADITQKRITNIISLMNGKGEVHQIENLTKKRLLFNIEQNIVKTDPTVITFREHDGKKVSEKIAVLTIEKGVFHEEWMDKYIRD